MGGCAVCGCTNNSRKTKGTGIKYFRFPKNSDFSSQWVAACGRKDKMNLKHATICSIHFESECFQLPLRMRLLNYQPKTARPLKDDAIPTLHILEWVSIEKDSARARSARIVKQEHDEVMENSDLHLWIKMKGKSP